MSDYDAIIMGIHNLAMLFIFSEKHRLGIISDDEYKKRIKDCDDAICDVEPVTESCEFCRYEGYADTAFPCSRCTHNAPEKSMWKPKER